MLASPSKRGDQVFQLSLTEIAFTIAFLLLLLVGWKVYRVELEKRELATKLSAVDNAHATIAAANDAKVAVEKLLTKKGVQDPEAVVSRLVERRAIQQERDALKATVADLDARLSSLVDLQNRLAETKDAEGKKATTREHLLNSLAIDGAARKQIAELDSENGKGAGKNIDSDPSSLRKAVTAALQLQSELSRRMRSDLGRDLAEEDREKVAEELVAAVKELGTSDAGLAKSLRKDNINLRGQVAFLRGRLEARGGRDYPPCWAEEKTGKVEYLFNIEIQPEGLMITRAWPTTREIDANALPGIQQLLSAHPLGLNDFNARMESIDRDSKNKNCRHYVLLRNRVNQLDVFNRYRFTIENYFYKLELRS